MSINPDQLVNGRTPVGTYVKPNHFGWVMLKKFNQEIGEPQIYMRRLYIFVCNLFAIYLHRIYIPDLDPDPHDHPRSFHSFVLWGGYDETYSVDGGKTWHEHRVRRHSFRQSTDFHRITHLYKKKSVTLVFLGRKHRDWGFLTKDGWVYYKTYLGID